MLKQGVVHEALADINVPAQLPPLNTLPQWSRVNTLDRARYPKPFLKDRLQPLPSTGDGEGEAEREVAFADDIPTLNDLMAAGGSVTGSAGSSLARFQHLERSILFLQQQHQDVLQKLHLEIDALKRENKDLQFQLIMAQRSSPMQMSTPPTSGIKRQASSSKLGSRTNPVIPEIPTQKADSAGNSPKRGTLISEDVEKSEPTRVPPLDLHDLHSSQDSNPATESQKKDTEEKLDEYKVVFLEEEINELNKVLREEKKKNEYLTKVLEHTQNQKLLDLGLEEHPSEAQSAPPLTKHSNILVPSQPVESLPFNATVNPSLQVPEGSAFRTPTTEECEIIVKHLLRLNDTQAHELNRLKSDLRDVLYSHKWTPDAYLLAKAYVVEDDAREAAEKERLPRIPLKQQTRKLPDVAYIQKDGVMLPALKQTMGNKAIERRKRTQILQKSRRREAFVASEDKSVTSGV